MMMQGFDAGYVLATIGFILQIFIIIFSVISAKRLRGSNLFWIAIIYLTIAIFMAVHSVVELIGENEFYYALTAFFVSILLSIAIILIRKTLKTLGLVN